MAARPRQKPDTTRYEGRVAQRISDLMDAQQMSASALAEHIGVDGAALRHWLSTRRSLPIDQLPAIAKALGVKVTDLLPKR